MTVTEDVPRPSMISDHPAHHPGHKLKWVANDGRFFMCVGCLEPGAGTRYRCEHERCNFELHTCCAVAPDTLTHPLFGDDRVFLFLLEIKPPATTTGGNNGNGKRSIRICVACGEDVRGFVYHCFDDDDDGLDLHPCCARLPDHALLDGPVFALGREASSRPQDMSESDDDKRSREIRRPPAARHRRWGGAGRQAAVQDRPPENTQPDVQGFELRHQEASRPRDMSDDRNRGRERRHPAVRHRWWKR